MKFFKNIQIIIIIFLILSSCGCNNSTTNKASADKNDDNQTGEILKNSKTINNSGGEVSLDFSGKKAMAIIPENALDSNKKITIEKQSYLPSPLEKGTLPAGDCIKFLPEGLVFKKKITLGIPFNNEFSDRNDKIGVKYYDPSLKDWTEVKTKKTDSKKNIVYFETNHFSNYLAYIDKEFLYPLETELVKGEYFTEAPYYYTKADGTKALRLKGCINRKRVACAQPWHLSVYLHEGKDLITIIDRDFTFNHSTGYPGKLSEDGSFIIFDAMEIFPKVKESGDARLWDWQCEFVKELTKLVNYQVYSDNDPQYIQNQVKEKFYSEIMAIDDKHVKIQWEINIVPEIKPGKTLSIRFEARYDP